jgi:hypothetical protein
MDIMVEVAIPTATGTQAECDTSSLNNRGVNYMKLGDFGQALFCLRLALKGTVKLCDRMTADEVAAAPWDLAASSNSFSVAQQVAPMPVFNSSCDVLHTIAIYLVPSSSFCYHSDELKNSAIQSAIVLYNLAVLFHLSSFAGGDKASEDRISKAALLYQRSKTVLDNMGIQPGCFIGNNAEHHHAILDVLGMATLNNLGHCLYLQDDYVGLQLCLGPLEQWVLHLERHQLCMVNDLNSLKVLEWYRCNCLLNLLTLKPPTFAAAA